MTEAVFEERFWFLTPKQRDLLRYIWRDGAGQDEDHNMWPRLICELVCDLADNIDSEAEWQRINKLTPKELNAELRLLGLDPEKVHEGAKSFKDRVTQMIADADADEKEKTYDQEDPT